LFVCLLVVALSVVGQGVQPDPNVSEELRMRDGIPNFFARLESGKSVRIAYLGGSITAAKGWRPKSFAWFKEQYPNAAEPQPNLTLVICEYFLLH
jgi:hypothetical protein